jgi:membrane fusion protein (multidrug efflux system)
MTSQNQPEIQNTPLPQQRLADPIVTQPKSRYRGMIWLTGIILLVGLIWFLLWFFDFRWRQYTDNAYVNGSMINVSPVISGSPIAFFADDTDLVKEGQLLVLLDDTPFKLALERELASLATISLQVAQFYNSARASIANVEAKQIAYARLKYDYDNRQQLIGDKAVSGEEYTHAKDLMNQAAQDLKQAQAQLNVSIDQAGHVIDSSGQLKTPLDQHPLILAQRAIIRQAYYNLKHCAVYAPATGFIAQRSVEVGQWVTPKSYMMAIIPIDYMWVDANYKETQLTDMRIGQPAKVYVDLYGSSVEYKGKVLGIASGTGNVFSLIPPQNATGNWIKIVQRLPVRISLDPETMEKFPLRLGLSAEAYVSIENTDLPYLATVPPTKPVATTSIFELDFSEIDEKMDQSIQKNLGNHTNHS